MSEFNPVVERVRKRPATWSAVRLGRATLSTSLIALCASSAFADGCVTSGNDVVCTGNPALPITVVNATSLTIQSLVGNLAPPSGTPVAVATVTSGQGEAAGSFGLAFQDAGLGWATVGASGLVISSTAGTGADSGFGPDGASGGAGGQGGLASVTVSASAISVAGDGVAAIQLETSGGVGGSANMQPKPLNDSNTTGGTAGAGGGFGSGSPAVVVSANVAQLSIAGGAAGIVASASGGDGGALDPTGKTEGEENITGSAGGAGGTGGIVAATVQLGDVSLNAAGQAVVSLSSVGGNGSNGGKAVSYVGLGQGLATGGAGGIGGDGASVTLLGNVTASGSAGVGFTAVLAQSFGGNGGTGGPVSGVRDSVGGAGGKGGTGGTVTIGAQGAAFVLDAQVTGEGARGLVARSYGGIGGEGGPSETEFDQKGPGGATAGGGDAAEITAWLTATVATAGDTADAIVFQSVGGFSGVGSAESFGAGDQSNGDGGGIGAEVALVAGAGGYGVSTNGTASDGVTAQSVGGGGGKAFANLGLTQLGGSVLAGGSGGDMELTVSGAGIATFGAFSRGIFASSTGGGGGSGGKNTGIATLGAGGGTGGNGGGVTVYSLSAITTSGAQSDGVVATSLGGGGGSAASEVGAFKVGGQNGGGGGNGGAVAVTYAGGISTAGGDADGIHALSVGGGGGEGANVVSVGVVYSKAVGGAGGTGGSGSTVSVAQQTGSVATISTMGDRSRGVLAQSVGGGGGSGGSATAVEAMAGYSNAVGGSGGTGGASGAVSVSVLGGITTVGAHSDGILAQSVGGGGGNASSVIDANEMSGLSISSTVGGNGGGGGDAAGVTVSSAGNIATSGTHSAAIAALATGGGGGHSGLLVSNSSVSILSVNVSVGGTGGAGGDVTGAVTVGSAGNLTTLGDHAAGILAHSTGGGGGHGSSVINTTLASVGSIAVELGGAGGKAGNASDVNVTSGGTIQTSGRMSPGISAVSTGGGGGSGGAILNANVANIGTIGVIIGASGGGGGSAGAVTVNAGGIIRTSGLQSDGIYASSTGGKGGVAGVHLTNGAVTNVATVGSLSIELGGKGGAGGNAGNVSVNGTGSIATAGDLSIGLLAQSMGGDGGRALGTVAGNVADIGNVTVAIGGGGGNGGVAGTVDVTTGGPGSSITTAGFLAHGIFAQSVGGSGGAGGFAAEASLNIGTETTAGVSGQIGVTIGGGGAPGGRSAKVTVQNGAAITTTDMLSHAIFAQSVGGNGGDGGNAYAFNVDVNSPNAVNVNVDVGGDGGFGAEGAAVQLTNTGTITTESFLSIGAFAQSVGGNGGHGGSSFTALAQVVASSKVEFNATFGGAGGGGGTGGAVTLTNHGAITTKAGGSDGLYAQSVGGGGGRGGNAGYLALNLSSPFAKDEKNTQITVGVKVGAGGDGGSGADAGTVSVTNTATVTTQGTRARAIYAQSVGGGGGDGGTSSATSFGVSDICNNPSINTYVCKSKLDPDTEQGANIGLNMTLELGGNGSTGGDGNTVTVNNSGNLFTAGQLSHGIYAQSVGGGGGNGGEGALGIEAWTTNTLANSFADLPGNFLPAFTSFDIAVGGTGAGGGDGGAVNITNSGAITIAGPDPSYVTKYTGFAGAVPGALSFLAGGTGIFAQSIGGGGGDGGAGSSSFTAIVTVGNRGGGGGQGGAVSVSSTGTITNTSGFSGTGIFAQSVGGGGGTAGNVGQAFSDPHEELNIGAGIAVSAKPGEGGDGGTVQVTTGGAIVTTGTASPGIVAQSVGGSGGIAAMGDSRTTIYVGSGVAAGNGGDVTITNNAPITVQGAGSAGIVALSAGGAKAGDQSGTVTLNVNADITASGANGRALLVSSDSYQNQANGDVTINVNQGVTLQTGAAGAETILVMNGGFGSTLENYGTIISGNSASEAIYLKAANGFFIQNYGTIDGSIVGEAASTGLPVSYSMANEFGGLLNSGPVITLPGPNTTFQNSGVISPGGRNNIATTTIESGLIIQFYPAGALLTDLDPSDPTSAGIVAADLLTLTAGTYSPGTGGVFLQDTAIAPNMVLSRPGQVQASGSAYVLNSNYAFSASDFSVSSTATVDYSLTTSTAVTSGQTTLVLGYDITTTPWGRPDAPDGILSLVNDNHRSFGRYLDTLLFTPVEGVDDAFVSDLGEAVLAIPDLDSLLDSYEAFIADEAMAIPQANYLAGLAFSQNLHGCGAESSNRVQREGLCAWGEIYGRGLNSDGAGSGAAFDERVAGLSLGVQSELDGGLRLGGAVAYESGNLSFDAGSGSVSRFMAGAMIASDLGALTLSGSLEGGTYSSSTSRSFAVGADTLTATGEPDGSWIAAHVRANRRFEMGASFLDPALDLGVTAMRQGGFVETGADGFNMSVSSLDQTTISINPSLTYGSSFMHDGMTGQVTLRAGILGLIGQDPSVSAAFVGGGSAGPTFLIRDDQHNLFGEIGAAVDLSVSDSVTIKAAADALFSDEETSFAARLSVSYAF